ncbi:MAG: DUF2497 domain-containing protein [Hyphomicrobium sp.]
MTRLDANGEPSMEEILASIRRIIAEEPPGSRAVAAPARPSLQTPSDAAATDRSPFARDGSTMASVRSDFSSRLDARPGADLGGGRGDAPKASTPATGGSALASSYGDTAERLDARGRDGASNRPAESVQAQLSDLLDGGDDPEADDARETAPPAAASRPQSIRLQEFAPAETRSEARRESSARFTVSRDGYVAPESDTADADPFDFDLGPSPFSKRATNAGAKFDAPSEDDFDEALGGPAHQAQDTSHIELPQERNQEASRVEPRFGAEFASSKRREIPRQTNPEPSLRPEPSRHEAPSEPLRRAPIEEPSGQRPAASAAPQASTSNIDQRTVAPLAAPSIAATLPPERPSMRMDSASSFARSVDMMSSRSGRDSMQDVVTEAVNAAMSRPPRYSAVEMGDKPVPVEVDDALSPSQQVAVRDAGAAGGGLPAVRHGETGIRSMEDTVADLLRPMLKVWLAENMPKIIERALRREISEMSLPPQQHKTAAE